MSEHAPGDPHRYRIECEVCGQRGMVRISIDPQYPPPRNEKAELIADIRRMLPLVAVGHPDLAVQISHAMDLVEANEGPLDRVRELSDAIKEAVTTEVDVG